MSQIVDDRHGSRDSDGGGSGTSLGQRLRALREARRWSLTDLAERSGVSRAMINRVERGASSPTAMILGRLSGALNVTVSRLLEGGSETASQRVDIEAPHGETDVRRAADIAQWQDPETGYLRRAVSSRGFPADVTEVTLPAGQAVTYPASAYAFLRHCIWVLDGALELVIAGKPMRLNAGDRAELGAPTELVYRNVSRADCRYVVIVVPAG